MTSFEKKKEKDLCNEKPRKPSAKVKNPCKICSETVNFRTGLQCKGACKKWAHFDCLKFSPKQVEDIQCGFIRINCPCPDCENDSKVNQSQYDKNTEYQFQPYGKYNECNKTFCPGITPQQKSSQKLNNLDLLNQMSKPLPYGVSEGTSYEYIVENQTNNVVTIKRIEDEQNDDDNLEQEEDEEKSDVEEIEDKYQTVLLAQSSSYSTEAICCNSSQISSNNMEGIYEQTTERHACCEGGPCNTSSSNTSSNEMTNEGKKKKEKKKKVKEKKDKKNKKEKKDKKGMKDKKEKKSKKETKEKRAKEKKKKGKKGGSSICCKSPCCNSDVASKESGESYNSESSGLSQSSKSTKSTQASCGYTKQDCPRRGASSPLKLTNVGQRLSDPKAPRPGPQPAPAQYTTGRKEYPIPPPRGAQMATCPPTCQGMQPASNNPPYFPGGGQTPNAAAYITRTLGKCAACEAGCCDPYRARTIALCSPSSTQVMRLSPLNKSKSCCTLDRSNKKEGTNSSKEISAHLVKCSKSDTKIWDQQQIDEYNRKMLLLALERICQAMGQFSVQFRELTNKITDKTDTQRHEELT